MPDTLLKDEPDVSESEFSTAILGLVSDGENTGRTRKAGLVLLAQMLQAENPLVLRLKRDTLYNAVINSSGIRNFDNSRSLEDYDLIEIRRASAGDTITDFYFLLFVDTWKETAPGETLQTSVSASRLEFYHQSDTSFNVNRFSNYSETIKIFGYKYTLSLETPI